MRTTQADTVQTRFFTPVERAHHEVSHRRLCRSFSDTNFIESGVGRILSDAKSARDWVQRLRLWMDHRLSLSNFLDALKSPRRLLYLADISHHVSRQIAEQLPHELDPLRAHRELDDFEVFASDGHFHQGCAHPSRPELRSQPAGSFFSINLRSHALELLDIARPTRKREHDMHVLKRIGATRLRLDTPKGKKVLHIYDCAGIDYAQWRVWKARGVYFLSREKENSKADVVGQNAWDRSDARNQGVLSDELVGVFCGVLLRRIRYRDSATGTVYSYMTNQMNLPPGLVAFLYKLRWDIEKVFDEKKNKLQERKDWAASEVAHAQQALFICLTHNLMVLFERNLLREENIRDIKSEKKRRLRLEALKETLQARGEQLNPLVEHCSRITQRSLQFIRWLRYSLFTPTPYSEGVALLRPLMEKYIS